MRDDPEAEGDKDEEDAEELEEGLVEITHVLIVYVKAEKLSTPLDNQKPRQGRGFWFYTLSR
jgi:hypothetical protein